MFRQTGLSLLNQTGKLGGEIATILSQDIMVSVPTCLPKIPLITKVLNESAVWFLQNLFVKVCTGAEDTVINVESEKVLSYFVAKQV